MLVLSIALGCVSLNKQKGKAEMEKLQQLKQKEQQLLTTQTAKVLLDTGSATIDVVFWPKGIVKYSSTTGFEGEAIQIAIRSKEKKGMLLSEVKDQHLVANSELAFKEDRHSQAKIELKEKQQHQFWVIGFWLILGICAAIAYLLYKRRLVGVK